MAYMTCTQFMDSRSDLIILVVNTIQRDLKSDNHLVGTAQACACTVLLTEMHLPASPVCTPKGTAPRHDARRGPPCLQCSSRWLGPGSRPPLPGAVCAALSATCKLLSAELVNAVLPAILELLKHPKELVRKKAVMALHRFEQVDPLHEGPLHHVDTYASIRDALRDKAGPA